MWSAQLLLCATLTVRGIIFNCTAGDGALSTLRLAGEANLNGKVAGTYTSTLLLTLTNPMTILSFAAVFVGLGFGTATDGYRSGGVFVLGVFLGSALWWAILSGLTSTLRSRIKMGGLRWVNRASGAIITAFGIAALAAVIW